MKKSSFALLGVLVFFQSYGFFGESSSDRGREKKLKGMSKIQENSREIQKKISGKVLI